MSLGSTVLFYEPLFLFVFFPLVYTGYVLLRQFAYGALAWIALASCAFYLWSEPLFFWVALASSVLDYMLGRRISREGGGLWLAVGVIANLALLSVFKYSAFAVEEIANPALTLTGAGALPIPALALPIGISFIVFEKITYLVDLRRGVSPPAESFPKYLFFVFFFPKLLAGPIIKYHELEPQLVPRPAITVELVALGVERFATGVVKKVLLADPAAAISDQVFGLPTASVGQIDAWLGALFFTAQIYFDFSAYSDMAIGLAMMLGFRLRENFNFPYTAIGITDFWRRWHISLSTWIRDYLYIPLGGSRGPVWRSYLNLFICFMASGIWHGAGWTFIAWGAFHGLFLVIERAFAGRWLKALPEVAATLLTFFVVMHGWVLFRAADFAQAGAMLTAMYSMDGLRTIYVPPQIGILIITALLGAISAQSWLPLLSRIWRTVPAQLAGQSALVLLFAFSLGRVLAVPFQPFLYFRF
jgi:alginate O-acetyltransferase complex protein AlgI